MRIRHFLMTVAALSVLACGDSPTTPDDTISLSILEEGGGTLVFGPEVFTRDRGGPVAVERVIDPAGFEAPFTLTVENGDRRRGSRVTSGRIWLGDDLLLGPSDFKRRFESMSRVVEITGPTVLRVELRGRPGTFVKISLTGSPAAPVVPPIIFETDRTGDLEIFAMNPDGSGLLQITDVPDWDREPIWSPDGETIAFWSTRTGERELWLMDADGSNQRQLTFLPGRDSGQNWSPDGEWIVWVHEFDLYRIRPDGSDLTPLRTTTDREQSPAYSPDGRYIMYEKRRVGVSSVLMLMEADGSSERQITFPPMQINSRPTWTADGSAVYTATQPGPGQTLDIARIRVVDGHIELLTSHPANDVNPVLSPDEKTLLFSSSREGIEQLYLLDLEDPAAVPIRISELGIHHGGPSWRR